jgi:serine/threonine protein kinase
MQLDEEALEEPAIAYIVKQVLAALVYLHGEHRVHRDIKAANVLLSSEGAVKISDFGVSGQLTGAFHLDMQLRKNVHVSTFVADGLLSVQQ